MTGMIMTAAMFAACGILFALARSPRMKLVTVVAAVFVGAAAVLGLPATVTAAIPSSTSAALPLPVSAEHLASLEAATGSYASDNAASLDKFGEMFGSQPREVIESLMGTIAMLAGAVHDGASAVGQLLG